MKIITASVFIFVSSLVQCQDFWLQPKKFRYVVGEDMKVDFLIGEDFEGEPLDLKKNKIEKIELHHSSKVIDLKNQIKSEQKDNLKFKFPETGTHLLCTQSDNIFTEPSAEKFNDYLKDNGLDDILDLRAKTNSLDKPSIELCTRYSKLLVQCGDKTDDTFKKQTGQQLEIIPQQNPYNLKSGDYLRCLILFEGKPIPHQLVKVWSKIGNTSFLQNAYAENDGTVKFPISNKGPWMIKTVRMIASKKPGAAWQNIQSSLVFGIE